MQQPLSKLFGNYNFGYGHTFPILGLDESQYINLAIHVNEINTPISKIASMFSNVNFEGKTARGKRLVEKLYEPNKYQSKEEFLKELMFNKLAAGITYIFPYHEIAGYERAVTSNQWKDVELLILNSDFTEWKVNGNRYNGFWKSTLFDYHFERDYKDLIIYFDNGVSHKCKWMGISRLDSLIPEIYLIQLAKNGKLNKMELTGAIVVTPDDRKDQFNYSGLDQPMPSPSGLMTTHKQEIENKLRSVGLANNKQIQVLSQQVKSIIIGEGIKDVDFDKDINQPIQSIYSKYNLGRELSNMDNNGGKYDNRELALLDAFTSEVMPFAQSFIQGLETTFGLQNGEIEVKYDSMPVYQKWQRMKKEKEKEDILSLLALAEAKQRGSITEEEYNILKNKFYEL